MDIGHRRIVSADAVGDALRSLVKSAKEDLRTASHPVERIVGRFGGFELGIRATRGGEVPNLYLAGNCQYHADPYQTRPALVAALELVGKSHADAVKSQANRRKRLEDLQLELARPFEHEGRLADLLARQRALEKELDLDRDKAGSGRADMEETRRAA